MRRQNVPECTKSHILPKKLSRGVIPPDCVLGSSAPDPRKERDGIRDRKEGKKEKEGGETGECWKKRDRLCLLTKSWICHTGRTIYQPYVT